MVAEPTLLQGKVSKRARVGGWVLTGLVIAFLAMDAVMKFAKPEMVIKGTVEMGFQESVVTPLGIVLAVCTLLYALPRTAVLGAVLLTGYLGGAVATHVRVGQPLWTHTLFPVYVGVILWLGLYLRDRRVRALMPLRSRPV